MNSADRHRRHDEAWQAAVLDGLARMMDVLHDISDSIRQLADHAAHPPAAAQPVKWDDPRPLLSTADLAEMLGVSPSTVYGLRYTSDAPTAIKVGRRLYFQRSDVDTWLQDKREPAEEATRPRRGSFLPGRMGSNLARSSEPTKRVFCDGSHTEPMAASKYSGRAVCRVCRDDVLVNRDGRLRKHYPRWWSGLGPVDALMTSQAGICTDPN